jgi:hypothetical protein
MRDLMGFPDRCIPLPHEADAADLSRLCQEYTARLLAWVAEQRAEGAPRFTRYDGSVASAGMSRYLLNIAKRSLPRLMLSGVGMANKAAM